MKYKLSTVNTLINRAFTICSSYTNFHKEIQFLESYFVNNLFPRYVFNNILKKFLNSKYRTKTTSMNVDRQSLYLCVPFIGEQTENLINQLSNLITKFYPQIKPLFYFHNNFKIHNFLKPKCDDSECLRSSVIYKYICDRCERSYIGSTKLQFFYAEGATFRYFTQN